MSLVDAASPSKTVWLASGVSLAVVAVVAAIFIGPIVVDCSRADAGFGSCITQVFAGSDVDAEKNSQTAESTVESIVPKAETSTSVAVESAENTKQADFDVRVEPDGSFVVAGSAPGSERVQIYLNDILLGTENTVGSAGDWVLVPSEKLAVGGHEIRVALLDEDMPLDKSYVVMIDDDLTSQPVVVAAAPGQASEVLQGSIAEQVASATEVVDVAVAETQVPTTPIPVIEVSTAADAINTAVGETVGEQIALLTNAPTIDVAAPTVDAPVVSVVEPEAVAAVEPDAVAVVEEIIEVAAVDPVVTTEKLDEVEERIAALEAQATAAQAAPTIDAIEIDGGRNYFAGSGQNGATVRLYVDNTHVADTKVSGGRWLFETASILASRSQRIRVDQLDGTSGDVAGRAEVDFVFEAPAAETQVAAAPEIEVETLVVIPTPDFSIDTEVPVVVVIEETPAESPIKVAEAVVPSATPEPTSAPVPVVESEVADVKTEIDVVAETASSDVAIVIPTPDFSIDTEVPVAVDVSSANAAAQSTTVQAKTQQTTTGQAKTVSSAAAPKPVVIASDAELIIVAKVPEPVVVAIQPEPVVAAIEPEPIVVAIEPEPALIETAKTEVPQLVAVSVGEPGDQRFVSGKAIIRKGDNLWTIARRVYGQGSRFTAIYNANYDQIRDPRLIYPGQVFVLPEGEGTVDAN